MRLHYIIFILRIKQSSEHFLEHLCLFVRKLLGESLGPLQLSLYLYTLWIILKCFPQREYRPGVFCYFKQCSAFMEVGLRVFVIYKESLICKFNYFPPVLSSGHNYTEICKSSFANHLKFSSRLNKRRVCFIFFLEVVLRILSPKVHVHL